MYPDLTAEELANVTDTTCIICREEMQAQQSIKRLGCQHIFHKNCLRSWFQRQQTCKFIFEKISVIIIGKLGPICRTTVLRPTVPRAAAGQAAPNAPAAAPQQQQAQVPNGGGVIQWKNMICN
jgi:E3 ubiquitin-protein ligase synoviolin